LRAVFILLFVLTLQSGIASFEFPLDQVTRSSYDAAGNLTNSIVTVDGTNRTNTFVYDALNRRVRSVFPDNSFQQTFYDELGRRIVETDQATNSTWFGYDRLGRLTSVTNMLGFITRYEYNEVGQQLRQIDARTNITSFDYDKMGRRVLRVLPGSQIETNQYNAAGLLTNRIDFNLKATRFEYDAMNRLTSKVPDASLSQPTVTFAYNALGLRTNMTDAAGSTTYSYDARNRVSTKTRNWSGLSLTTTLTYGYDQNGSVTNIVSSNTNGTDVDYGYDELSRLSFVDLGTNRTSYTYDDVGNLRSYTHPNGVSSLYEYDSLNRLTNLKTSKLLTEIAGYAYQVNTSGHRTNAAEQLFSSSLNAYPSTINRTYTYDSIYQLQSEAVTGLSTSPALITYNYDEVGNRLSRTSNIPSIVTGTNSFNANDRLNTDTYDANGNTIAGLIGGTSVWDAYDFENRLINRNTNSVVIRYDGDGNRVSKTVDGVTTLYVFDELNPTRYAQVLEELTVYTNGPAVTRITTYGHAVLAQDRFNGSTWITSLFGIDGHGNVRYLTDTLGQVTDTYDYDAFGNLVDRNGLTDNNHLFTGEQYDPDLELYYLRARYHNPNLGRFWTMDSFDGFGDDPGSLHKYTYVGNNPCSNIDPTGNLTITENDPGTENCLWAKTRVGWIIRNHWRHDLVFRHSNWQQFRGFGKRPPPIVWICARVCRHIYAECSCSDWRRFWRGRAGQRARFRS
jgi:RHS repeat-associated protein